MSEKNETRESLRTVLICNVFEESKIRLRIQGNRSRYLIMNSATPAYKHCVGHGVKSLGKYKLTKTMFRPILLTESVYITAYKETFNTTRKAGTETPQSDR